MKRYSFIFLVVLAMVLSTNLFSQDENKKALIIIDIQEFYFPGGFSELHHPEEAAKNASLLLNKFREKEFSVVHVQHQSKEQMAIHKSVEPIENEKVVTKNEVSCFNGTGLNEHLKSMGIEEVTIVGMQTHMCVEAATRAAYDLGYKVNLISDACTTRDLKWDEEVISWEMVHYSTLSTLKNYAEIFNTDEYLEIINQ